MYIKAKIQEVQHILDYFNKREGEITEKDYAKLGKLENIIGENPILIKYQCICLYNAGYTEEAVKYLSQFLTKFNQSYELHSLMFELLKYTTNYKESFYSLSQMYKQTDHKQEKEHVLKLLEEYVFKTNLNGSKLNKYLEFFKINASSLDFRMYPIDQNGNSMIRVDALADRDPNYSYIVNLYKSIEKLDVNSGERFNYLYEMIKGKLVNKGITIEVCKNDIIAISSASKSPRNSNLLINYLENTSVNFQLEPNSIRYFKMKDYCNISIDTDSDILVVHFKNNVLIDKPKLVLQIFIDGLSFDFVNANNFKNLMPNTFEYFKSGYVNNNCHANAEWTLPSLLSMCTGKYTTNHYVYDTKAPHKGEENNKFIQEFFEEAGYMTGRICPNWRGTPTYGYFKSTNRSVYSPMMERMNGSEVIMETLEHLEAFKEFNNYVWVTIEDLHSVADGIAKGILQDVNVEKFVNSNVKDNSDISVFRSYNEKKIEEYKSAIKRVDFYLGILFDYLDKNYNDNEIVITLNSDHGQKFIEEDDYMFTKKRTNVPFMMKGKNVINKNSNQLMSNIDIVPTVLNLCGLQSDTPMDGSILKDFGGEEKEFVITESIFPEQTYKIAINDTEHLFMLETVEPTRKDGLIPLKEHKVKLINHRNKKDEAHMLIEKVEKYTEIAFEHIKEWIAFDN